MQLRMRILVASYRREDVTIELYGRTDDGMSVTALYYGFKPYFDLVEPEDSIVEEMKNDPEYFRMEEKTLWYMGRNRRVVRFFINSPWKVPEYRERYKKFCPVLAADIPFHHRFIYDMDLGSCVYIEGEEERDPRYSTDLVLRISKIENTDEFNPKLKVLSIDIENAIQKEKNDEWGRIFTVGYTLKFGDKIEQGAITDDDEKRLLEEFVKKVRELDPDVIIGYNIDGYDMPVLQSRMKKLGVRFSIGRDGGVPSRVQGRFWRLHGRVISDVWWSVKKIMHPKSETLNYVAKELLGEGKDNINRLKIEEEWSNRRDDVIRYCIKDTYLTVEVFERLRVLDRNMFMSTVTRLPLDDVTNGGTSNYVDSILIRRADRLNIGVPLTANEEKEEKIPGGYVHTIVPGLYSNVVVLDFKSMYPSMIMKYNICFTTLSPEGTIVAPSGARFLDKSVREGLIPSILRDLMEKRDAVKRLMKSSTGEEREYWDGIQNAIKVLMNTFYGVMASPFYRFTNVDLGSAVTSFARDTITRLIDRLEKRGFRVIYGDTDSVFIESGAKSVKEAVELGSRLSAELSREEGVTIEFEKVMDPLFSHGAKKRYAGKIVYPEDAKGTILVRGYETRRTDSFDLQSEALARVFDLILQRDIEGAINYSKDIVRRVLRGDPSIPLEKLVISRSVKSFDSYEQESLANVRVAKKLIEMGETFVPGMKVSWIVTNSRKSPQEVEPYIDGTEFRGTPDWEYYARRIEETLNRVLESLQSEISVISKSSGQRSLDTFVEQRAEEKGQKKNVTLDSFF